VRLARGLGSRNVDSRLRQADFTDQANDPAFPGLGIPLAGIDTLSGLLLAGCQVREEAPIVAHRVRKAALGSVRASFRHGPRSVTSTLQQTVIAAWTSRASSRAAAAPRLPPGGGRSLSTGRAIVLGAVACGTQFAEIAACASAKTGNLASC
jgi:hypothetical protein